MKTSKIIFISFFSIVGLFLLSLMIQTKPENRPGHLDYGDIDFSKEALPKISHLIVQGNTNISLCRGVSDSIMFGLSKGTKLEQPFYQVKGDTLIVHPIPDNKGIYTDVFCGQLKSITLDSAKLIIKPNWFSNMNISGTKCDITCWDNVTIDSLTIDLKARSDFSLNNSKIMSAEIMLDRSTARYFNVNIKELKAELINNSELSIEKALHSDVRCDHDSRFYSR